MRPAIAMAVVLLSAGSAEARKAFVALDPDVLEALDLKSRNLEPVDVSKERARLQKDRRQDLDLDTAVFPDEPPPAWASPDLKKDWEDGTAGCRAKVGPAPYAGKPQALFCAQDLGEALWQRHLERLDATGLVLAGGYRLDRKSKLFQVSVLGYQVNEPSTRSLSATAETAQEALSRTVELLGRLIDGKGSATPRKLVRNIVVLSTRPESGATPLAPAQFKPVPAPAGCQEKLPRRLELGSDQASVDLDRLWTVSVTGGKAPSRACTLTYRSEPGDLFGVQVYIGRGSLECNQDHFEARSNEHQVSMAEERTLKTLLDQAFKAWCK